MTPTNQRWMMWGAVAAACVVALWFWPLFHIVRLDQVEQDAAAAEAESFEPAVFVERFWDEELIPAAARAVDAQKLLAAIQSDRAVARKSYGRSVGLSSVYYYFIAGSGRVVEVDKNSVGLAVESGANEVQVTLETGPLFGNAIRDGTGLLDVNDFNNSQAFNAISSEINRRVEAEVLPRLREIAKIGAPIRFVGCAQITDEDADLMPLRVVPLVVEAP